MKKILIIAGGGVFGRIPSYFLSEALGKADLHTKLDAIGGTSVGGILGLMYANGINPAAAHDMFGDLANRVFRKRWYTPIKVWGPKYGARPIEKILQRIFEDTPLRELSLPVIIPTLDFTNNKPKVWDNLKGNVDGWQRVWEVARMTSAAPTYFPPFKGHIDGGLLANVPVLETITALHHKKGWQYRDMDVLVIGTGRKALRSHPQEEIGKWGGLKWLSPLLSYLTYANEQSSEFLAKQMGLGSLQFLNPVKLRSDWSMDDADLLPELDDAAGRFRILAEDQIDCFLSK